MKLIDCIKELMPIAHEKDALEKLINGDIKTPPMPECDVSAIIYDSRKIVKDSVFVALCGMNFDGHKFLKDAIEKGACAVVTQSHCIPQEDEKYIRENITVIDVTDTRKALALLSAAYFGKPAERLVMIGITGTKGKTTTAHMIKSILEAEGNTVGMIGTVGCTIGENIIPTKNTTPESYELHSLFRKMLDEGCTHCVMEVSSQAFKQDRVYGIVYDHGAFLNISPDHIGPGEHKDFEEYFECKKKIADVCTNLIINADDERGRLIARELKDRGTKGFAGGISDRLPKRFLTVGIADDSKENPDIACTRIKDIWEKDIIGSEVFISGIINTDAVIPMPGRFNVENALVAAALAFSCGIHDDGIKKGLRNVSVKGRTQVVREASHIATFIIDYAHNAVSAESLLSMLKGYNPGKLICVFGGGGNKPKARRFAMGAASGKYADLTIITTDNPRFEEIDDINKDIIAGLDSEHGKYEIIKDRKEAIEYLLQTAKPDYIVALIGKGHETYQDIKGVKTYFSEEEIIKDYVKAHAADRKES